MQPLLGQSQGELTEWVTTQGQPAYRGQQLYQWLYQRGIHNLSEISVFPKQWRETIATIPVGRSLIHHRVEATDGTVKYLLQLGDGEIVETVGIPSRGRSPRLTVCVSSQVGCPMGCDFCATAKGGFRRNLEAAEIIDQVLTVQEDFGQRVSHIVFMGMGEPLLNIEAVLRAIRCLNQDIGIGQRSMTVSTVGIPGQIRRLGERNEPGNLLQFTLAVSLHASNQTLREQLIPSAKTYPLSALLQECRDYVALTHRRISFEYILLAGLNDRPEQAKELAQHLRGFQSHVNLIPYNPISEVDYQRPDDRSIQQFLAVLKEAHIASSIRYSRGLDANAACGQLRRSRFENEDV
ncbi:MAG: 23S rRNA (adenine(2503)-C(2))-methyltransferase RlmN [Prochlorotrichaceae cyanobacterium]